MFAAAAPQLTSAQVKVLAGIREEEVLAPKAPASAGGIEWQGFDTLKLPEIVGGGAVSQNMGADVFDFHEQQQQAARGKRPLPHRPAHL